MELTAIISISIVVVAQFINAMTILIDKHIITKTTVSRPGVYAFYVAITSAVLILALPFKPVTQPDFFTLILSVNLGFIFFTAILYLYRAIKHANATDVVAWLAAVSALTTFIFANVLLDEELPKSFPLAMVLILAGMLLVGHFRFYSRSFVQTVFSGVLFGFSIVLTKILFSYTGFWDGFFWSRMGNVFAAVVMLLFPFVHSQIFLITKETPARTGAIVVSNKVLAGMSLLLTLYATSIGSVSIVNALASLQFVFVFVLILLAKNKLPDQFHHEFRSGHILHKVLAMLFIIAGFFVLFI